MLLVAHAITISLLFLTRKKHFPELLFCAPLLYIIFFVFFNLLAIPLLFPFILIWLAALLYQKTKTKKIKIKIKTEILLLAMFLGFLFAAFPIAESLPQFRKDLSNAFMTIKNGSNRSSAILWLLLIASNGALISIAFFRKKKYFNKLLIWIPAFFIAIFIVYNYSAFFFLIPFIGIWVTALIEERQHIAY
ncbi:MAG: hypothetical protein V5804_17095 [Mucilaginibacter sp.]|uniref:hypothetical protein n=1 Tax=Mucilaginibacter sp. TaxID=1882438 RepID=UPI0034E41558